MDFKSRTRIFPSSAVAVAVALVLALSFAANANEPNQCASQFHQPMPQAEVLESDIFNPDPKTKSFDLSCLTQDAHNKISKGPIHLELMDDSLGDISLERIRVSGKITLIERYAFQIMSAAEKAALFYAELGVPLPLIELKIQDPNTPPLAYRSGNTLSFTKLKSLEKVEGSSLNVTDFIPMISDVVAHEVTHMAQGHKTFELLFGHLGASTYEGHANLMAYMIVGRTDLGVLPSKGPGMRVWVPPNEGKFGRQVGGGYDSYQPFSSVLAEIHKAVLAKFPQPSDKRLAHMKLARIFFNIVGNAKGEETYRELALSVFKEMRRERLLDSQILKNARRAFIERGLDLSQKETEGYFAGILVNGQVPDESSAKLIESAKSDGILDPTVELQRGFLSDTGIAYPLEGIVLSEDSMMQAISILAEKAQANPTLATQPMLTAKLYRESLIEVGKNGVDLGGVVVRTTRVDFNLDKRQTSFASTSGSDGSKCKDGYAVANLMIWDKNQRVVAQTSLPFACR